MEDIGESNYWQFGYETIKQLETERGILASGRGELFGTVFGRDSLITSLLLLRVHRRTGLTDFLPIVKKALQTLIEFQGREINVESGEQPGKILHEYRPDNHEHLTKQAVRPWYVYPNGELRSYDTIDATPLFLITAYRFWQASKDRGFIKEVLPHIEAALQWLVVYGDTNGDGFLDYQLSSERQFGGLDRHSWMDSSEALFDEQDQEIIFPVAPVEVQAYAYHALNLWADFFGNHKQANKAKSLRQAARDLKKKFNQKFIKQDEQGIYLASHLDGSGRALSSVRSNFGHCLWASLNDSADGRRDGIVYKKYIPSLVRRLLSPDMFAIEAGIRTLSQRSSRFEPNSYHNGSIWPHDNGLIVAGLENWGYDREARAVRQAVLKAIDKFQAPVELYVADETGCHEYCAAWGQKACRQQAWSAAAILDMAVSEIK